MFSAKSGSTSEQAKQLRKKLEAFFSEQGEKVVTASRLYSYSGARSLEDLAAVLTDMVIAGQLEQLVRVEFDGHAVETFKSTRDIPNPLYDPYSACDRWVEPDDCKFVYRRAQ